MSHGSVKYACSEPDSLHVVIPELFYGTLFGGVVSDYLPALVGDFVQ